VVEVQIYDVPICNARVVEVEGASIDLDTLVEVVVSQVDSGYLVGQKFKKSTEDMGVGSGPQDDIFVDIPYLKMSINMMIFY